MSRIAESELIINKRGAIYHLDLRPEELGQTVLFVGDPDRVERVSAHFDTIEVKVRHREFVSHTGMVGKQRVSCISTGIGTDNIDIALNEVDALANIDFETRTIKPKLTSLNIMRIGTSGSLQGDIPVDAHVASTHGLGIDNLLHFYRLGAKRRRKSTDTFLCDSYTTARAKRTPLYLRGKRLLIKTFCKRFLSGYYSYLPRLLWPAGKNTAAGS